MLLKHLQLVLVLALFNLLFSFELYDNENYLKSPVRHQFNFTEIETGPCNIPIINEPITEKEFLNKYAYSTPVVFRRYDLNRNKLFKEKCEIDNLYNEYGHK